MKDNFNVYEWRIDQIRKENISEQLDDEKAVQSIASAVSEFADIKNDKFLQGVIRTALGSGYIKERVVEDLNEDEGTLNKIADILGDKFDNLRFDVNEPADRIDVRGSQQDLFNFGDKLHGEKIYGYEVFHVDDDDRGEIVRIIKSDKLREEKKKADRCLRIARRKNPQSSAYRSGLIVKCRKGMIWKDLK